MNSKQFLTIIILIILIIIFFKINRGDVIYVKSDIDDKYYLVRDTPDKHKAANLLARIRQDINKIVAYLNINIDKYKENKQYINQLTKKINGSIINESSANSSYTSYSVNKGEQIVFCIRSKRNFGQIHDYNIIMYVALHEIAHVACPEYGHTQLFKQIFAFLTNVAIEMNIYKKIDFNKNPEEYCGLMITDSIV